MEMQNREAEFNATILELRKENASLQERVAKEESEKLVRSLFIDLYCYVFLFLFFTRF